MLSAINSLKTSNNGADFAQAQANARNGSYYDITAAATTQFSSDIKIGVKYNALTDQIMVNGVVQGSGGYVYLNGKIISTSTDGTSQGTIAVKGGAGTITVNNTTGLQLVTNTINTGVSAPSVIQIVDQLQQQTTWYVYNPSASGGQQVSTYRTAGVNASAYTAGMLTGIERNRGHPVRREAQHVLPVGRHGDARSSDHQHAVRLWLALHAERVRRQLDPHRQPGRERDAGHGRWRQHRPIADRELPGSGHGDRQLSQCRWLQPVG